MPPQLDNLGIVQLSGPQGFTGAAGATGPQGVPGTDGTDGADGTDGTDGSDGTSNRLAYRKTFDVELLDAPVITFDGTSLTLPTTDGNAWQLQPYSSRIESHWQLHADNTSPKDIDVDTSVSPHVIYVLDDAGRFVYRYDATGSYIDRWALDATNNTCLLYTSPSPRD